MNTTFCRRTTVAAVCLAVSALFSSAARAEPMPVRSAEQDAGGVTLRLDHGLLRLDVRDERTVRVRLSPTGEMPESEEYVVVGRPVATPFEWKEEAGRYTLRTAKMGVNVDRKTGAVSFVDAAGKVVLDEPADGGKSLARKDNSDLYRVEQTFDSPDGERIFGLSQSQDGVWDWRGLPIELRQLNTQAAFPMMVSSRGYGLLWNNASLTDFNPIDNQVALSSGNDTATTGPTATEQLRRDADNDRARGTRVGTFTTGEAGEYVFFAKDGDRRNDIGIAVDGKTLTRIRNLWVPYTTVGRVTLPANTTVSVRMFGGGPSATLYAAPRAKTTTFRSHAGRALDYVFFYGPDLDSVVDQFRQATGPAPLWPNWAYGFWQCRERYASQRQIVDTAAEFRRRGIPIDLIVQDWQYWGPHGWGAYQWDEKHYPDPAAMIDALHTQNVKFMISVWSNPHGKAGDLLKANGHMIPGTEWVDAYSRAARAARWDFIYDAFGKIGTDAWWQDATEPGDDGNSVAGKQTAAGPGDLVRNAYPLLANQTVYEGQRKSTPDKRVVILTRSTFPGLQRYGAALWSGDIGGNWETLRKQIPAGLHVSLAGLPYWTTDAGGFFRPRDQYVSDDYAELLVRWFQFSTFCPVQRIHGYQSETEFWKFPKAEQTLVDYTKLRYRLLPYIYSAAWGVTDKNAVMMRPLAMDFRDDPAAVDTDDQYLFGQSLLVCPVTRPKATSRPVYLPGRETWTDFWTGQTHTGGRTIDAAAPRERIPLFVRAGAILPVGPDVQYADQKTDGPIELRVYRGASGAFDFYQDAGDGYGYESGQRSVIPIRWDEPTQTLSIGDRQGAFPGMAGEQAFRVVFVRPGHGVGAEQQSAADAEVHYTGRLVTVKVPAAGS